MRPNAKGYNTVESQIEGIGAAGGIEPPTGGCESDSRGKVVTEACKLINSQYCGSGLSGCVGMGVVCSGGSRSDY